MSLNRYFFALQEKLKASDSMSDWISDFKKSDAPQFAGKSEEKRRQMAIAAKLGAERGQQNEASLVNYVTKGRIKMADDAGEPTYAARKKAAQMQQQVVDQKYIKKVMDGAKGGVRTNTGVTAEETVRDPVMSFASKAHEEWRSGWRKQNDGNSVPRVKKNSDGSEGDINVPFNKLHPDWQKENLAAGNAAKDAVTKHPNDIEKAAEHVHNKWMERNPKQDYNAAQHVPYSELPEDEKEKDRVHVRTMQNLMSTNEEIQDSGWKEPQTAAKTQNRAKNLARKAMKQAVQKVKDEKGFGPSPADKLSIRKNEEVELGEELSSSQRDTHFSLMNKHGVLAKSANGPNKDAHRMAALDHQMALRNPENSQSRSKALSLSNKLGVKEDVELDEGKYGAFRTGPKRPKYPYVPPGNQDPRTGLPLGFSPPPNKDEPKDKKVKEEVELSEGMSHSELADHHFNLAKKYYKKSDALENSGNSYDADHFSEVADAHATAHHLHKQAATSGNAKDSKAAHAASREANDYNVNEQVELDELDQKTLSNYATRAKFSSDPERRKGAAKAQEKIDKKSKDMQKKEAEQVDEALRHEIAGQVAAFLGNKIDPLHGQIMHVHGKEAYRQAATHIRRVAGEVHDAVSALHDKLHKHLRTGGIATEEVELDESHFKVGDKVKCKASGMKGEVVKLDKEEGGDTEKYYTVKREDGTTKKMAPKDMTKINEETDQIDEVSAGLAKSVAQRRDQDFRKMTPTETQKRRMGRGDWRADPSLQADKAYKSAVKRGAKDVYGYKEETELDEDGKLKGGAKDPCWTGYKMVGTKKKGGREVPNCVPREGTEQNTFKALREKLNGNSNRS